jgi:hypothetical protein
MGTPLPESTLTLCQSRLYPPAMGTLDLASVRKSRVINVPGQFFSRQHFALVFIYLISQWCALYIVHTILHTPINTSWYKNILFYI